MEATSASVSPANLYLGDAMILVAPRGREGSSFFWSPLRPLRFQQTSQRSIVSEAYPNLARTSPSEPDGDLILSRPLPHGFEQLAHSLGKIDFPPVCLMVLDGSEVHGRLGLSPHFAGTSSSAHTSAHGASLIIGSQGFSTPLASSLAPTAAANLDCLFDANRQILLQCGHLWDTLYSTAPQVAGLIEGGPHTPLYYLKCLYTFTTMSSEPHRSDLLDLYLQGGEASDKHTLEWASDT